MFFAENRCLTESQQLVAFKGSSDTPCSPPKKPILHAVIAAISTMTQQKALFLSGVGGTWAVGERDIPKPGVQELLVKIHSTALNPIDWKAGKYPLPFLTSFPVVLGSDSAGTVEAVGESVGGFKVGDKV